jgi:hypothetical protein
MKIIKYMLLLFLLAIIGLSVFVATQKSTFTTSKSIFIKVKKPVVFSYLNDYKNWEEWNTVKEDDPDVKFSYPDLTAGVGASYSKNGKNGLETTTTTTVQTNENIAQKVTGDHYEYESLLKFTDSIGGTKLTWTTKGTVDFKTKIKATFSGGIDYLMGMMFERNLYNLNAILHKELNIFDVSIQGIIQKKGGFYLKQSAICNKTDYQNKLQVMLPRMIYFFKNNNLKMNGKPFVIYENKSNDSLKFSVCGPLVEEIFVSENSDIEVGFLEPFYALKSTLVGDYSHLDLARKKAKDYVNSKKIVFDDTKKDIDVFTINSTEIKNPSKWNTSVLTPIIYKNAVVQSVQKISEPTAVSEKISEAIK